MASSAHSAFAQYVIPEELNVKRKGTQSGTLQERNGKWVAHFSAWRISKGGQYEWARQAQTLGTVKELSERKARAKLAVLVDDANRRAKQPAVLLSLGEFIERRFEKEWLPRLEARGQEHYRYLIDQFIVPGLGKVPIDEINVDVVQRFLTSLLARKRTRRVKRGEEWVVEEMAATISIQTVHHVKNALSAVFTHMERLEMWSKANPCSRVTLPKLTNAKRTALTAGQVEMLAAELRRAGRGQTALLVLFLAWTGLRISEAVALRWKWLNLGETPVQVDGMWVLPNRLYIAAALSHGEWSEGKSGAREGVLVEALRAALTVHRAASKWNEDEDFVFAGERSGNPLDEHNELKRFVKPALKRAGLPNIAWHDLRHTFETLAHGLGLSSEERMAAMGHSTPKMTARYTHVNLDALLKKLEQQIPMPKKKETLQ